MSAAAALRVMTDDRCNSLYMQLVAEAVVIRNTHFGYGTMFLP